MKNREYVRMLGSRGGKKTASRLTAEERKARARKAIKARWDKYRENKQKGEKR